MGEDYETQLENLMNETPNPQTGSQDLTRTSQAATATQNREWLERLKIEVNDLDQKGQKLSLFIRTNLQFPMLPDRDKYLLEMQLQTMGTYFSILNERLTRALNPEMAAEYDLKAAEAAKSGAVGSGGTDGNG